MKIQMPVLNILGRINELRSQEGKAVLSMEELSEKSGIPVERIKKLEKSKLLARRIVQLARIALLFETQIENLISYHIIREIKQKYGRLWVYRDKNRLPHVMSFCHRSDVLCMVLMQDDRVIDARQKRVRKKDIDVPLSMFQYMNCVDEVVSETTLPFNEAKQFLGYGELSNKEYFEKLLEDYPDYKRLFKKTKATGKIEFHKNRRNLVYLSAITLILARNKHRSKLST